ncbi:MAG: DNA translocase FtsK, partial [Deinococcus sp.]
MTTRRAKKAPPTTNRFDGEVLGLVLFAFAIFLAITVALPANGGGFMAVSQDALSGWLSWSAYLLPLLPAAYGVMVFLGRDLKGLNRRALGGVLLALSLLALHELVRPGEAGELAARLMTPLTRTLSYAAALPPLVILTLGLELLLGLAPTLLLRRLFRGVLTLLGGAGGALRSGVEARKEGHLTARSRASLRSGLAAHIRDLETLRRLYPQARELGGWQDEARAAARSLPGQDEGRLAQTAQELAAWREVSGGFVQDAARELREGLAAEAPEAGERAQRLAQELRSGRHPLGPELPSTLASAALESVRRALVMDLHRLAARAASLEQGRARAGKALHKADAGVLLREVPAAAERREGWEGLRRGLEDWEGRAGLYPGWPALALRYDHAPTELAAALAEALRGDPFGTLADPGGWTRRLEGEGDPAEADSLPTLDFSFEAASALPGPEPTPQPAFTASAVTEPIAGTGGTTATLPQPSDPLQAGVHASVVLRPSSSPTGRLTPVSTAAASPGVPGSVPVSAAATTVLTAVAPPPTLTVPSSPTSSPAGTEVAPPPLPSRRMEVVTLPWEESDERPQPRPQPSLGAIDLCLPGLDLLDPVPELPLGTAELDAQARGRAGLINQTLAQFGLSAKVVDFARGPTVTRYEIEPAPGEKISRIAGLSNDLARALAVGGVRVEAPVPGKSVIGLEVPNAEREPVTFHTAVSAPSFQRTRARLPIILGKSIDGEQMVG